MLHVYAYRYTCSLNDNLSGERELQRVCTHTIAEIAMRLSVCVCMHVYVSEIECIYRDSDVSTQTRLLYRGGIIGR